MKLYEIQDKFSSLLERYNTVETDEERAQIAEELGKLECTRDEKLSACCAHYFNLKSEVDVIQAEIDRLKGLLGRAEGRAENFKDYIAMCFPVGDKWKKGPFSLSYKPSEAVKILDETQIPASYLTEHLEYVPNKKLIASDLKIFAAEGKGKTIPGVELEVRHNLQVK